MADLQGIRQGLASNLSAITGLQVSPYVLPSPTPPSVEIVPSDIEYDQTFGRGTDLYRFTVRVFVGTPDSRVAQVRLDTFLAPSGSESFKAALESDRTLGGSVSTLRVINASGYRMYGDSPPVLGAEWTVEILS
jgi:hypothetical protein